LSERSSESDVGDSVAPTLYTVVGVVGGVSVLILVIVVWCRCRHRSVNSVNIATKTSRTNLSDDQTSVLLASSTSSPIVNLEISPSAVQILRRIGNARFGTVYIGNIVTSSLVTTDAVVVKTLAGDADPVTREFFTARTRAMVGLKHCNVLGLVGACLQHSQSGIISALYEHYDGLDLNTLLQRERTLSRSPSQTAVLMKLAVDSACGLTYLSEHSITHGDISSDSILVVTDAAGNALTAKICDLALASPWCCHRHRSNCLTTLDSSAVWPQRPPAPELLLYGHVAITEATDVWQFGVVVYQIYYVIRHRHLVAIVTDCCSDEPARRPRFKDIHHRLMAASVTFDPVTDPVTDPVIDRVTGEVMWECSPATSNETGYSVLMTQRGDGIDEDDDVINEHQQQTCRHDNGEVTNDVRANTRSTLPRSSSSRVSSQFIV